MKPIAPVLCWPPMDHSQVVFARDQPQYRQLPRQRKRFRHRYDPMAPELARELALLLGRDLFLQVHTFGDPLQPVKLMVGEPA